ncbi:NAD dependent epimerase/dehydratase [Synechococcus sp. RCC307]|nr:NAD dependent epimerase/dehydratase [Synechococcus sp. RCC307]
MKHPILVTGAAGFIGAAVCKRILADGESIIGIDNINDYYDPGLKISRLKTIEHGNWQFEKLDISNQSSMKELFAKHKPCRVIHLAAQAGVRYSIENPSAYIQSNLVGFGNILEGCRHHDVKHLVYASSSSVYGGNTNLPFQESQAVNHPISLYAATKKSNELMAHTYSHLYGLPATGLRFFTVYGPWGRPDMAPMLFAKAILSGQPIRIFNNGLMQRDFTYIDDIVEGIVRVLRKPAAANPKFDKMKPDPATSWAPHRLFNIGNSNPIPLMEFINCMEDALGIEAIKQFEPIQPGDVEATAADTAALHEWVGFKPSTSIEEGVKAFARWYRNYYQLA